MQLIIKIIVASAKIRQHSFISRLRIDCLLLLFMLLGADIIGINCHFGPDECIEACRLMKEALDAAGMKKHLMVQPLGYLTPDAGKQGFIDLPEFPFG